MELSWKLLCLCSGLLFFELCNGFPINTENAVADQHTQLLTGLVAVLLTVCSVVFLAGCLCCRRRNGFKEFRDSPVVASASSNLDHGHVNPITNGEFTIFTPLSPPHVNNNVFLASEQIIIRTAEDYKYGDIDVSSWFDGSNCDFPRIKLKYIKELGKGWFGKVVEGAAQDIDPTQSWTPVVVRILDTSASSHKRVLFLHEAEIYRCRPHQNLLGLVGRCLDTAPLLLMQEHCAEGDLKGYLRRNKGNAEQLLTTEYPLMWCCQLTSALKHLHDYKLVHHDVATRNCQLTVNLTLKLGDYGLGPYKYPEDYYQGAHDVPVRWASPESLNCTSTTIQPNEVTVEANIWSLGVTMWEICECGDQPYSDLSDDEVVTQVFGPNKLRLGRPSCPVMYTDYIFRLMQLCWTNFESRPAVSQIDLMLGDLLRVHKNTKHPEPVSSDDFDKRWQSFKPNAIIKTDNHVSINIEETPIEKNLRGSLNNLLDVDSQPSWVENGEISYVGRLSDAISDLDNDLTSSPPRLFKLGPTNDSLTDSMIYVQRTSSESETEDENWRKKVERGAYTEKVRLKSRSVADLMILTHVDYSESESETPLHSLDYKVNKNGRKSNLETVSFASEGNLLNVQDDFQEELKKLQVERRDSLLFVPDSSNSRSSVEKIDSASSSLLRELNSATEIKPANQIYNVFNVTISKFTPIHVNSAKFSEIINMADDASALCFDRQNSENRSDLGYNTLHNSEIGSTDEELAYRAEDKGSTSDLEQDYDCRDSLNEERVSLTEATNFLLNEIFLQAERIVNHHEDKIENENVTEVANGILKDVFSDAEERLNANINGSQENLDGSEQTKVEDTFSHVNTEESLKNNVQKFSSSRPELVKTDTQSSVDGAISRRVMPDLLCDLISSRKLEYCFDEENHDLAIEKHMGMENEEEYLTVEDDRKETSAQNEESTTNTEKSKLQNGANQINFNVETLTEMEKEEEEKRRMEIDHNKEEVEVQNESENKRDLDHEKHLEIEEDDLEGENIRKEEEETASNTEASELSENRSKYEFVQERQPEIEEKYLVGEEIRKEEEETAPNTEVPKPSENQDKYELIQVKQLEIKGEDLVEENIRKEEEETAPNPKDSNLQSINIEKHMKNQKEKQLTPKIEEPDEISRLTEENTEKTAGTTIEVPKLSDIIQNNDTLMDYIITNYDNEEIDQNASSNDDPVAKFVIQNTTYDSAKEIRPKIEFDVSKEQQEAMPNSLTHSSVFNTSTPFKKPSITEDYCSITSAKSLFDEKTQTKLDYSLETWDNFLEKTMDTQRQQENEILFDSFSSEPQSLLFLENDENNSRSSDDDEAAVEHQTYTLDEPNGTFDVQDRIVEEREDSLENRTYDIQDVSESDDAQGTWQQGEGWYLHPQSSNENLSGEMEMPHTSKTDSYVGFNMDDEIMAAIRNELLQKLPHAQGSSNDTVKEEEEWESGERNEVFIKYNVYNTPLSPIPEESYTEDGVTVIESDDSTPKQQDSDSDWSDDDDDDDDDDDGNYQPENLRTVQHHPRQDSCCSNDTLFNLDELALCGETKTENNNGEVDHEEPTRKEQEEEEEDVENDPPASLNSDISSNPNQSTTTIVNIIDESVSNSSSSANETSLPFAAAQVAPLPSPEDNPWKQLPASLLSYDKVIGGNTLMPEYENVATSATNGDIFNEADYVTLENTKNKVESFDDADEKQFIVENERKEEDIFGILTDIRFSGPIDSQLMSTSFSESNDNDEQDWDSGSDTRSSSSGEFIWKEGEHEESLKALRAAPQDVMEDVKPMEGITEEITSESDVSTSSDDEGDSPEFVPSAWDKYATPTKSALRSPEKILETPEKKKSRGVWFKKQKYHCVYEYPREPESPVLQSQDLWTQQPDFSPFAGNMGVENEFFVSGSNRPFDMSSQFFPGSSHWIENATPDSGTEDTTPGSSTDSTEYPTVATLLSKKSVEPLKTLAAEVINKGKTKSNDVLGGLRHTRNKLKLDLPPSPSAFTSARTFTVEPVVEPVELRAKPTFSTFGKSRFLVQHVDTPPDGSSSNKNVSFEALPYKPVNCIEYNNENTKNGDISYEPLEKDVIKDDFDEEKCKTKVEFVRGEASLLDSADEDSGIESSTLERKFCNTVE